MIIIYFLHRRYQLDSVCVRNKNKFSLRYFLSSLRVQEGRYVQNYICLIVNFLRLFEQTVHFVRFYVRITRSGSNNLNYAFEDLVVKGGDQITVLSLRALQPNKREGAKNL